MLLSKLTLRLDLGKGLGLDLGKGLGLDLGKGLGADLGKGLGLDLGKGLGKGPQGILGCALCKCKYMGPCLGGVMGDIDELK